MVRCHLSHYLYQIQPLLLPLLCHTHLNPGRWNTLSHRVRQMAQTFGQSFHQGAWVLHMIFLMHKIASSQVS